MENKQSGHISESSAVVHMWEYMSFLKNLVSV